MTARCLREQTGFGIIASINNKISDIGCYVKIDQVLKTFENGSSDILVKGIERFFKKASWATREGYLEASVMPFNDIDQIENTEIIYEKILNSFRSILTRASIDLESSYWKVLHNTKIKSFKLAEKSGLLLIQQQQILSLQSESRRLEILYEHFKPLENKLEKNELLKELIAGDGYFNKN